MANIDNLPVEITYLIAGELSPESQAALSRACRRLQTQLGRAPCDFQGEDDPVRARFLTLLERDMPDWVYCVYCRKLHLAELAAVTSPAAVPARACQDPNVYGASPTYPAAWHPTALYGLAKARRDGRDASPLETLLPKKVVQKIEHHHSLFGSCGCPKEGSPDLGVQIFQLNINEDGIFVRHDTITYSDGWPARPDPDADDATETTSVPCKRAFHSPICEHLDAAFNPVDLRHFQPPYADYNLYELDPPTWDPTNPSTSRQYRAHGPNANGMECCPDRAHCEWQVSRQASGQLESKTDTGRHLRATKYIWLGDGHSLQELADEMWSTVRGAGGMPTSTKGLDDIARKSGLQDLADDSMASLANLSLI